MNLLITASLNEGNVNLLFNFPVVLVTSQEKKYLRWIIEYTKRYSRPPSLSRFTDQHPLFVIVETTDPLADVYDVTLTRKRNIYTREFLVSVQEDLKKGADPVPIIDKLHEAIRGGASDVVKYSSYDRTAYHRQETSYPYEIEAIDQNTGGIAAGDLIYLIGRLGTGKTTFALWILKKWLQRGRRILMVSNENRADDVVAKIDSYVGGFNPLKKRTREWNQDDLDRLKTVSFIASHMEGEVFIPNRPVNDMKDLTSLMYTYRPELVMVDGIYLMNGMEGNSHWEKITNISRELKQIAEGEGVPIVGIHQANRQAIGRRIEVEHIAYADALAQDADLLLGINPEEDGSIFVEAIKNRWGGDKWGFFLKVFFDTMSVKVLDGKTL